MRSTWFLSGTADYSYNLLRRYISRLLGEGVYALDFSLGCPGFDSKEEQTFTSWLALVEKKPPKEIMVLVRALTKWYCTKSLTLSFPTMWRWHTDTNLCHVTTRDKTFSYMYLHCTKIRKRFPHITCNRPYQYQHFNDIGRWSQCHFHQLIIKYGSIS